MAWELQTDMHSWIAPSIAKAAEEHGTEDDPLGIAWLCQRYADQRWDPDTGDTGYAKLVNNAGFCMHDSLCHAIADHAIEHEGSTTNGGHAVYLDGWTAVKWCSEDAMLAWYS